MLDNCKECGRLFNKFNRPYCNECEDMIDGYYQTIRDYICKHGQATIFEIHEATGIKEKWILKLKNEGRLLECGFVTKCESCGVNTTGGRLCEKCAKQMTEGFKVKPKAHGFYSSNGR